MSTITPEEALQVALWFYREQSPEYLRGLRGGFALAREPEDHLAPAWIREYRALPEATKENYKP